MTALVALLDVATEGRGPAERDIPERFFLLSGE